MEDLKALAHRVLHGDGAGGASDSGAETARITPEPLQRAAAALAGLRQQLAAARCWDDLTGVWQEADRLYGEQVLCAETVEQLTGEVIERSRQLPEKLPEGVLAADLLPEPGLPETCPACGQQAWWTDGAGVRKCGVCHPDPRVAE